MTTSNDNILAALKTLRQEGVDTTALQYQLDEELYYSELAMHRPHPDYVLPDACYTGVEYAEGSLENPRGCPWNIRLMRIVETVFPHERCGGSSPRLRSRASVPRSYHY